MGTTKEPSSIQVQVHEAIEAYHRDTGDNSRVAEDFIERVVRGVIGLVLDEMSLEATEAAEISVLASRDFGEDKNVADFDVHWRIALEVASGILAGKQSKRTTEATTARLDYLRSVIEAAS